MDLDVIEATAEALPLELLNKTNKELTAQLSHAEEQLDARGRSIEDQRKRLQFMREHLGNVRAEIVNTQSLAESKRREVESEENVFRLMSRECGRLRQRQTQLERDEQEVQDLLATLQNRIFQGNLRMDEFKRAMDFNQDELEQWDAARRQKEEDELAVAQYSKQDEAKMRLLRLKVEKLEKTVREQRQELDEEVLATQKAQVELDRCATDYRKLHDDRGGLLDEWEQVVRAIAERDIAIQVAAEQYADGVDWLARRHGVKKEVIDQLDEAKEETAVINAGIKEREKRAQQFRDAVPALSQQVQELVDEVDALREQVSRTTRERNNLAASLQDMDAQIKKKAQEQAAVEQREQQAKARLEDEIAAAEDMEQQNALIARLLKDAEGANKSVDKDIEALKKTQFTVNEELHAVREKQAVLLSDINGAQAQGRNLNAKVAQLDSDSLAQQKVLYDVEFSVQQMEKKVHRAKGERTEEERRELHQKIELLEATLSELEQQHRVMDVQVKRVREELRRTALELARLEATKKSAEEAVLEINLQCGHGEQEVKQLERVREDLLVKVDTMELQLTRLKHTLQQRSMELLDLEERKRQLAAEVAEREVEIAAHHDLLKMEGKLVEEERKRLVSELLERRRTLSAVKNRHEVLVGRLDPAQARLSQAQLVVEAAKERESLQYRGDSLDARIKRVERELLKLEKTIAIIKASNHAYKHKFDKVEEEHEEMHTQRALKERFRELKAIMSRRSLQTNDYQGTLQAKRSELEQLYAAKEQRQLMVQDVQQAYDVESNDVLQTKEAIVRYEQAIEKASRVVEPSIARDVALAEEKARLGHAVERLLQASQLEGEEVYEAVKQMVVDAQLLPLAGTASTDVQ